MESVPLPWYSPGSIEQSGLHLSITKPRLGASFARPNRLAVARSGFIQCQAVQNNDRDNRVAAVDSPLSRTTTPRLRFIAWFAASAVLGAASSSGRTRAVTSRCHRRQSRTSRRHLVAPQNRIGSGKPLAQHGLVSLFIQYGSDVLYILRFAPIECTSHRLGK
jgi:hypothetical protein